LVTVHPSADVLREVLPTLTFNFTGLNLADPATIAALAADPNVYILNVRLRNLAVSRQDGFDVSISNRFVMPWGEVRLGATASRIFEFEQAPLVGRPTVTVVD